MATLPHGRQTKRNGENKPKPKRCLLPAAFTADPKAAGVFMLSFFHRDSTPAAFPGEWAELSAPEAGQFTARGMFFPGTEGRWFAQLHTMKD